MHGRLSTASDSHLASCRLQLRADRCVTSPDRLTDWRTKKYKLNEMWRIWRSRWSWGWRSSWRWREDQFRNSKDCWHRIFAILEFCLTSFFKISINLHIGNLYFFNEFKVYIPFPLYFVVILRFSQYQGDNRHFCEIFQLFVQNFTCSSYN